MRRLIVWFIHIAVVAILCFLCIKLEWLDKTPTLIIGVFTTLWMSLWFTSNAVKYEYKET